MSLTALFTDSSIKDEPLKDLNLDDTSSTIHSNSSVPTIPLSVLIIMDGSGSMSSMGQEPLQGLNNLIKQQKETGDFRFTLVVFNENSKTVINDIDGKDVPELSSEHYSPDGMTALLDAMGNAITTQKERKIENVLVVVITDGLENASRQFNSSQRKELTTEMQEKHKWAFMYLGANQDSFSVARGLGINVSTDYDYSPAGCNQLFRGISHEISRCISGETTTDNFKPNLDFGKDNLTSTLNPIPLGIFSEPIDPLMGPPGISRC
jgi:hypothetical protein